MTTQTDQEAIEYKGREENLFRYFLKIRNFPGDGAMWRIDWLGSIEYADRNIRGKQPVFHVHLSRISEQVDPMNGSLLLAPTATDRTATTVRQVAVGLLPFIRVGDIWRGGYLFLEPDYQIEQFSDLQIGKATTSIVKAGLNKNGRGFLIPLDEHPWHRNATQSYCIEVATGEGRRLLVPCMELVRFYFGSSSTLTRKLFMPPLSKDDLFSGFDFDEQKQHLHLKLSPDISGYAAADIARICQNTIAWRSASLVGTSMLKAKSLSQPVYPQALFPFEGATDLVASGKWVSLGGIPDATFIVFGLRSCSFRFPFVSLSYDLQKPSGFTPQDRDDLQKEAHIAAKEKKDKTLVERDASTNLAQINKTVKVEHRFPDLARKAVWKKEDLENSDIASAAYAKNPSLVAEASVGEPGSTQPVRSIELDIAYQQILDLRSFMSQVFQQLKLINNLTYRLVTAGGEDGITVSVIHRFTDDPHLYIGLDNQRRLRKMSVLRIYLDSASIYLAMIEDVPGLPFFIDMPETSEGRVLSIAAHQYLLWVSKRIADSDRFGFRSALNLMGQELEPLLVFLRSATGAT